MTESFVKIDGKKYARIRPGSTSSDYFITKSVWADGVILRDKQDNYLGSSMRNKSNTKKNSSRRTK